MRQPSFNEAAPFTFWRVTTQELNNFSRKIPLQNHLLFSQMEFLIGLSSLSSFLSILKIAGIVLYSLTFYHV